MFFGRAQDTAPPIHRRVNSSELLRDAVRAHLPEADAEAVALVTALCGLLASIAYADREYTPEERAHVRESVERVHGMTPEGTEAICSVLDEHLRELASVNPHGFARELRENGDIELRREVLDVLVDLGAADGELSLSETNALRRTTTALGLSPDDYVISQQRHRDKLTLTR